MKTTGDKIKELRIRKGITQEELANKIGYKSKTTVAKIEANINDVPTNKIEIFADLLDTTPSYLLGWDNLEVKCKQEFKAIELVHECYGKDYVQILKMYDDLNDTGKKKAYEDLEDMSNLDKYSK